jgi:hypothetical protein
MRTTGLAISVVFAISLASFTAVRAADFPPDPSDPKLAEAYAAAKAELAKVTQGGGIEVPANKPWPCAVPETKLRKWTGKGIDSDAIDPAAAKLRNQQWRALGMKPMKVTFRDVRFIPISASCKGGKLDGMVEFFVEYVETSDTETMTTEYKGQIVYKWKFLAGERDPNAPQLQTLKILPNQTVMKDPEAQAIKVQHPSPAMVSHSVHYNFPDGYAVTVNEMIKGGTTRDYTTSFFYPTGPKRAEMQYFRGADMVSHNRQKDGRQHGVQQRFPYLFSTITVPGSITCFENGEEIKTTNCDVQ